jgi:hypothetical protein
MAAELLREMDEDQSGEVSFEEFHKWWKDRKSKKPKGMCGGLFKRKKAAKSSATAVVGNVVFGQSLQALPIGTVGVPLFVEELIARFEQLCGPGDSRIDSLHAVRSDDSRISSAKTRCH